MAYIYIKECDKLPDPLENPSILNGLSEERKRKILKYKFAVKRRQCLAASLLLKNILEKYGYSWKDIHYSEKGKPEADGLFFNISHSGNIAICAVSEKGNIGCDVEKIKEAPLKLAERYFSKHELNYLDNLAGEEKNIVFYRLWTIKESYMKMTGEGIGIGLSTVEVHFNKEAEIYRNGDKCECSVNEYTVSKYKIAVCTEATEQVCICGTI